MFMLVWLFMIIYFYFIFLPYANLFNFSFTWSLFVPDQSALCELWEFYYFSY